MRVHLCVYTCLGNECTSWTLWRSWSLSIFVDVTCTSMSQCVIAMIDSCRYIPIRILYRVLFLSTVLNAVMMFTSVMVALTSSKREGFPFVQGTVFQNAGVWMMPLITCVMYGAKMLSLRLLLQKREMKESDKTDVEKLKSVTYRRSYLFGVQEDDELDGVPKQHTELVMTRNPLSALGFDEGL